MRRGLVSWNSHPRAAIRGTNELAPESKLPSLPLDPLAPARRRKLMFSNLIESGSHAADLKRKGRFFLGTTAFYLLLLAGVGVGSIYAYNARLDAPSDYELLSVMRFAPAAAAEPERREQRPAASQSHANDITGRRGDSVETPYHGEQIASTTTREEQ